MQLGFVGLGRMGLNMVKRLQTGSHTVVAYDRDFAATARAPSRTTQTQRHVGRTAMFDPRDDARDRDGREDGRGRVYVNGGRRGFLVSLAPSEIVRVLGAMPVDVAISGT